MRFSSSLPEIGFSARSGLYGLARRASFAGLLLAAGCSIPTNSNAASVGGGSTTPTNAPPVIDDLVLPQSATPINGLYEIDGTISYHDDASTVHAFNVRIPAIGKTYTFAANDESTAQGEPIAFTFSADVPLGGAGAIQIDVSLTDATGVVSAVWPSTVVLQ